LNYLTNTMDLFAQLNPTVTTNEPVVVVDDKPKIITVAIEKIKNKTITAIYELDFTLDHSVKSPAELLSKLKKKICNSNGFIRKPKSKSDDEEDEEVEPEQAPAPAPALTVSSSIQYVIQGNHSNAICRYLYSLGVKDIIRTGN